MLDKTVHAKLFLSFKINLVAVGSRWALIVQDILSRLS